ncbi:hypothetical protein llap_5805 [Limosa lapponica baueri]|uniref:Uncharacterized protein n=1 Tax=Limosa lapponica baueri TaxID=1758121 RepID=A0A2I0UCW0_LIMLA|nr:hypothetical protein llap_5805 [Limosa lapponica baueri]
MILFKSNCDPVCDKQYVHTPQLVKRGSSQDETLFKDIRMAMPQLDMKEKSFLVYMKIMWDLKKKKDLVIAASRRCPITFALDMIGRPEGKLLPNPPLKIVLRHQYEIFKKQDSDLIVLSGNSAFVHSARNIIKIRPNFEF